MSALTESQVQSVVSHYAGLVFTSAVRIEELIPTMSREDVEQELWIKVVKALRTHDPERSTLPRDRYVFACVRNGMKDLLRWKAPDTKKGRHADLFIEDLAPAEADEVRLNTRDHFDFANGHFETAEDVFGEVEGQFTLPSTLTEQEAGMVVLLLAGYTQAEAGLRLGLSRVVRGHAMQAIRLKLADWAPSDAEPASSGANGRSPASRSQAAAATSRSASPAAA